ncbi:MAG: dihydropteroate synthase [Eubacterium ventriosum]
MTRKKSKVVVPVIEAVKKNFDIAVSLDTHKTKVAEAGVEAGRSMGIK